MTREEKILAIIGKLVELGFVEIIPDDEPEPVP